MSQPIEDQTIALSFLSKLRQWKPIIVTVTRDVAVTDFGRLIILSGNGVNLNLPNQPLARSGSLRVTKLSLAEVNLVECGLTVNNVVNLNTKTSGHDDIRFDGATGRPVDYVDLVYNHETDIWYSLSVMQQGTFDGLPTTINGHASIYNDQAELSAAGLRFPRGDGDGGIMVFTYVNPNWGFSWGNDAGTVVCTLNLPNPSDVSDISLPIETLEEVSGQSNLFVTCAAAEYIDDAAAAAGGVVVGGIYRLSTTKRFKTRMA